MLHVTILKSLVIKENVAAVSPHGVVGSKAVAVHGVFMVLQKEKESPKAIGNGFGAVAVPLLQVRAGKSSLIPLC